jgi:hypothetical protein
MIPRGSDATFQVLTAMLLTIKVTCDGRPGAMIKYTVISKDRYDSFFRA